MVSLRPVIRYQVWLEIGGGGCKTDGEESRWQPLGNYSLPSILPSMAGSRHQQAQPRAPYSIHCLLPNFAEALKSLVIGNRHCFRSMNIFVYVWKVQGQRTLTWTITSSLAQYIWSSFFSPIIQRYLQCFGSNLLAMFEGPLGLDSIRGQGVGISVLEGGCLPAFAKGHIDPGAAQHSSPSSKSSLNSNFLALSG